MNRVVPIITGPTASGKSKLAMDLARTIPNSIIVGADSMQIYKYLDIGTAKPSIKDREEIPHYLIDILELNEKFGVDKYQTLALEIIEDALERGKMPIVCGGTPQYVTSLMEATKFIPESTDKQIRLSLEKRMEQEGSLSLLDELRNYDPNKANKLHSNDKRRIIRALEIIYSSSTKQSEWDKKAEKIKLPCEFKAYSIEWPREVLYSRINARVDNMISEGLLEEAYSLYNMDIPSDSTCLQAIGYKEFFPFFRNEINLEVAIESLKKYSRRYAKRQLSWFRYKNWINNLDHLANDNLARILHDIS